MNKRDEMEGIIAELRAIYARAQQLHEEKLEELRQAIDEYEEEHRGPS